MANLFDRLLGREQEVRSAVKYPPRPSLEHVSPEKALTLSSVYRAVQIIAVPVSNMNLVTTRYAGGLSQTIENPLLVNKPSLNFTRREFLYMTVSDLALYGNAYWLKNLNNQGAVNNLEILAARHMTVTQEKTGGPIYFDYKGQKFSADQIQHLQINPRADRLMSLGPIHACHDDIRAALDLRDYQANWFSQAGIPTGVLKTTNQITKDDADRISADWAKKQQERKTAVLGNSFSYDPVSLSPKDALFTDVAMQSVQNIARLFGIPPRLLLTGVDGSSDTYTNLQDENQVFYRHTLLAYTDTIDDALSECLPRGTSVQFDFEDLFRADIATRYNYYKVGVDGGWLTPADVQMKEGLDG